MKLKITILVVFGLLFSTPVVFGKSLIAVSATIAGGCIANNDGAPSTPILASDALRTSWCIANNQSTDVWLAFSRNTSMPVHLGAINSITLKVGAQLCDSGSDVYTGAVFCESTTSTQVNIDVVYERER